MEKFVERMRAKYPDFAHHVELLHQTYPTAGRMLTGLENAILAREANLARAERMKLDSPQYAEAVEIQARSLRKELEHYRTLQVELRRWLRMDP